MQLQKEKIALPSWQRCLKHEPATDENKEPESRAGVAENQPNMLVSHTGAQPNLLISHKVVPRTEQFLDDKKLDAESVIANVVKGYMYGDEPVSFEYAKKFESGGKQLRLIGFTKAENVTDYYLVGEKFHVVTAQKGFPVAAKSLAALTRALRKNGLVMVARYVYNAITEPKLMLLFPNDQHKKYAEHNSLLMSELVYPESFLSRMFPSLQQKSNKPTEEQYAAVEKLMDCMDLMNANDADVFADDEDEVGSKEAFRKLLNPAVQHTYRAIAHRALHPRAPVLAVDKDLKEMLDVPVKLQKGVAAASQELKALFELKNQKEKFKKTVQEKRDKIMGAEPAAEKIGTVSPEADFVELLHRGERFENLAKQLDAIIDDIIFKFNAPAKLSPVIFAYREAAKTRAPYIYNEWIAAFKGKLLDRDRADFWEDVVVKEGYGLLTSDDAARSTVTLQEANEFYSIAKAAECIANDGDNQLDKSEASLIENMFA